MNLKKVIFRYSTQNVSFSCDSLQLYFYLVNMGSYSHIRHNAPETEVGTFSIEDIFEQLYLNMFDRPLL